MWPFVPCFSSPQSSIFACSSRATSSVRRGLAGQAAQTQHGSLSQSLMVCIMCIILSRPFNIFNENPVKKKHSGQIMLDKRKRRVGLRQSCCHFLSTNFKSLQKSAECSFFEAPFPLGVCCPHVFALLPPQPLPIMACLIQQKQMRFENPE